MNVVTVHGPLFNGQAAAAMRAYIPDMTENVAEMAESRVRAGTSIFRHPTGAYESRITTRAMGDRAEVHDQNSVYGPWLEGTGSRNRTTRFKGYHFWRKAGQEADARALPVAEQTLQPYLRRMQ